MQNKINKRRLFIILFSVIAAVCLVVGIVTPMITVKKIIILQNTLSIWSGIMTLLADKTFGLGIILFLFSILFPVVKITLIMSYGIFYPVPTKKIIRYQRALGLLAKFSMLDVFVVALMLMILKLGWILETEIHSGIYWFSAAAILTILLEMILAADLKERACHAY